MKFHQIFAVFYLKSIFFNPKSYDIGRQTVDISQTYQQTSVKLDDLMGAVHVIMMQTFVPFVVIAYITILAYKLLFWDYVSNSFLEIFPTT